MLPRCLPAFAHWDFFYHSLHDFPPENWEFEISECILARYVFFCKVYPFLFCILTLASLSP